MQAGSRPRSRAPWRGGRHAVDFRDGLTKGAERDVVNGGSLVGGPDARGAYFGQHPHRGGLVQSAIVAIVAKKEVPGRLFDEVARARPPRGRGTDDGKGARRDAENCMREGVDPPLRRCGGEQHERVGEVDEQRPDFKQLWAKGRPLGDHAGLIIDHAGEAVDRSETQQVGAEIHPACSVPLSVARSTAAMCAGVRRWFSSWPSSKVGGRAQRAYDPASGGVDVKTGKGGGSGNRRHDDGA